MIAITCWCPALLLGKGPTQSVINLLKDCLKAGIGPKGAAGIC